MENGYQTVRCLFCTTGKEELVVQAVEEKGWGKAIFPKRSSPVRKGRQWIEMFKPLLPGYVFVYSDRGQVRQRDFLNLSHVIRVLSYDGERDELTGRDLEFAGWIWQQRGRVGVMKALQIGDWIEITDGAFKQLHGTIVRMDRRRRTFLVSLNGEGAIKQIWLTYEVIEKRESTL